MSTQSDPVREIRRDGRGCIALSRSVTMEILVALPRAALLGWIACCGLADHHGVVQISRAALAKVVGQKGARAGSRVLEVLLGCGLLELRQQGGSSAAGKSASIYQLTPTDEFDAGRALGWLEEHTATQTRRLRADLAKAGRRADPERLGHHVHPVRIGAHERLGSPGASGGEDGHGQLGSPRVRNRYW